MVKTSEEVGKVSHLIKEDISQMGVKAWGQNNSGSNTYNIYNVGEDNPKIYWDKNNNDFSSYALYHRNGPTTGTSADSIVFRKASFDKDGLFIGIREIVWEAIASKRQLVRRCATIQKCTAQCGTDSDEAVCPLLSSASAAPAVVMAENITNFSIIPSKPGKLGNAQDTLFGKDADPNFKLLVRNTGNDIKSDIDVYDEGTNTIVSNFAQNDAGGQSRNELYLADKNGGGWSSCKELQFKSGETYAIEFKMPFSIKTNDEAELQKILNSTQFVPGRDHLAIGLKRKTGEVAPGAPKDILFYPAQSPDAADLKRHVEFSMSADVTACVVITMAYYPPAGTSGQFNGAEGKLNFKDFKVFRKSDETFHFPKDPSTDKDYGTEAMTPPKEKIWQKTNAKAFELILEIENKGEKSGTYSIDNAGNKKGMVIPTPNNGVTPN